MSNSEGVTYDKYPSTPYLPCSPGKEREDKYHPDPTFFDGREVVLLEKMDGEHLSLYSDGHWHARSVQTPYHPTREWAGRVAGEVGYKIPDGWRVCAENLYGTHSIKYTNLRDYVQVYGIVDDEGEFLSWPKVCEWCELLDLTRVPVLQRGVFEYRGGAPIICEDSGAVIHLPSVTEEDVNGWAGRESEGYVMRTVEGFPVPDFEYHVGKWVRENHVQTGTEHWLREWPKNGEVNELKSNDSKRIS